MVIVWRRVIGVLLILISIIILVWALLDREAASDTWEAIIENNVAQMLFFLALCIAFPLFVLWLVIRIIKMVIGWIKA